MQIGQTMKSALVALFIAAPALAEGAGIALPSGRVVAFHDAIWGEPGPIGLTVRFRFLEPDLAAVLGAAPYAELEADMAYLCENYALGRISNIGPQPTIVMVSISDRPVEFGDPDPAITQVFEAYRPENGACLWEGY